MKKVIAITLVLLMFVLLITSISRFIKEVKPFFDYDEETVVSTTVKDTKDLEFKQQLQIEDFLMSVSENYKIALGDDGDIFLAQKSVPDIARFEFQGAIVQGLILITDITEKEFKTNSSNSFSIPMYWNGERVKSAIAFIESPESGKDELIIRSQ